MLSSLSMGSRSTYVIVNYFASAFVYIKFNQNLIDKINTENYINEGPSLLLFEDVLNYAKREVNVMNAVKEKIQGNFLGSKKYLKNTGRFLYKFRGIHSVIFSF